MACNSLMKYIFAINFYSNNDRLIYLTNLQNLWNLKPDSLKHTLYIYSVYANSLARIIRNTPQTLQYCMLMLFLTIAWYPGDFWVSRNVSRTTHTNEFYWVDGYCIKSSNITSHVRPLLHTLGCKISMQMFKMADKLIWLGSLGLRPSVIDFSITFGLEKFQSVFQQL